MILHKYPRRLASARAGCLLDGGGFDGYPVDMTGAIFIMQSPPTMYVGKIKAFALHMKNIIEIWYGNFTKSKVCNSR